MCQFLRNRLPEKYYWTLSTKASPNAVRIPNDFAYLVCLELVNIQSVGVAWAAGFQVIRLVQECPTPSPTPINETLIVLQQCPKTMLSL